MVTGTIEGSVSEAMEKTINGIVETSNNKIVLVPEKIVENGVKKNEMVAGESQRGKGTKEVFEAASETSKLKLPPEPSNSWPPAMVPPQRAPCLKSSFLGFPFCVDVFLTNPPPNPPDQSVSKDDDGYKKGSLERRRKEQATGGEPPPTAPVASGATTREWPSLGSWPLVQA